MAAHGLGEELIATGSEEEAVEATGSAVRDGYDVVVGAGGDGTIGTVARELLGTDTALGVLPLGSIMNIARMLGIPRDLEGAAEVLAGGHVRRIDVGDVDGEVFFEAGSVGLHAAIFREAAQVDEGDYGAVWRSIVAAFRYRPSRMELALVGADGEEPRIIATRALLVAVANGPFLGAGFTVAPDAALDDGLLDVRIFRHFSKRELIRHFAAIAFGRRAYAPHTDTERAVSVTIRGRRPLPARADGVDLGHTPVTFGVRAGSLLVVAPPVEPPPR
jgi:diacylglycerol kinase (ATP)